MAVTNEEKYENYKAQFVLLNRSMANGLECAGQGKRLCETLRSKVGNYSRAVKRAESGSGADVSEGYAGD